MERAEFPVRHYARMASIETPQANPEQEAAELINRTLEEEEQTGVRSPEQMQQDIREKTEHLRGETREKVSEYLDGMVDATKGTSVEELGRGIGGLYNGSERKIARDTVEVRGGIRETVERMREVSKHELYHAAHHHLAPMETAATKEEQDDLRLGGASFTEEEFIEGLTVHDTGNTFVSEGYRGHENKLVSAASAAGMSMGEVRRAINEEKDLTLIDDRTREGKNAEVPMPA